MMSSRVAAAAVALFTVLATAACTQPSALRPSAPASTPHPSAPPAFAAPLPSPTEPQPDRLPAVEDLVIMPAGIGSLLVGAPVSRTDMVRFEPEHCAESYVAMGRTSPGMWVPNYPNVGYTKYGHERHLFNVWVEDDTVRAIEIVEPTLRTIDGIGIGSSIEELSAAYPSLTLGTEGIQSKTLVLATDDGEIVFEVMTGGLGEGFEPGKLVLMRIYPPGLSSTLPVAGSDGSFGC